MEGGGRQKAKNKKSSKSLQEPKLLKEKCNQMVLCRDTQKKQLQPKRKGGRKRGTTKIAFA